MQTEQGTGYPRVFAAMLRKFREEGCAILVTGDATREATATATGVFLGSPESRRYRVLAFAEPNRLPDAGRYLPVGVSAGDEGVFTVEYAGSSRSAAGSAVGGPGGAGRAPAGADALDEFLAETSRTLADVDGAVGPLPSGALRLCVLDLCGLVVEYGPDEVEAFCRTVGAQVRGLSGMAYFHAGTDLDDGSLDGLVDAFDAVVEVGVGDAGPVQRWHLPEYGYVTDWMSLEPPE